MKSLYFRLLLWLVAAFVLIGATLALSVYDFFIDGPPPLLNFMSHHLESTCGVVLQINDTLGPDAARDFMQSSVVNDTFRWHLFISGDSSFSLDAIPDQFHPVIQNALEDRTVHLFDDDVNHTYGAARALTVDTDRSVVMLLEGRELEHVIDALGFPATMVLRTMALVLTTAVISFGMYRSLVKPLRQLETATGRFGEGDLKSRVTDSVIRREDEIAAVARSFNTMAQRVEELVASHKQLLHDVSHELRSPLTRIGLAVELAQNETDNDTSPDWMERITKEVQTLDFLIDQLLTLSRIDANTEVAAEERVDLVALLESMIEDARFESASRSVGIVLEYNEPVYVRANIQLLYSAVENVLRNAIRHTPDGTSIDVTLQSDLAQIVIVIRDKGPGVDESQLTQLFEPFFSTAHENGHRAGAGIGLSITQRVIRQLGGTVSATNADGGGLECRIVLPSDD